MWYASMPTPHKARKHYSQLVLEIYRAVWEETQRRMVSLRDPGASTPSAPAWNRSVREHWRALLRTGGLPHRWTRGPMPAAPSMQPPIAYVVAQRLLLHHWLLVFDEVQLLDVSSATLLADVLSWFWRMGGVLVGSSNRVPDDLYMNGVQRERLEPFVEALKARTPVLEMRGQTDWREKRALLNGAGMEGTWYTLENKMKFGQRLEEFVGDAAGPAIERALNVFGRPLIVPRSSGGVCKFTFSELCDQSLGAADYLTLASTFHTMAITSIPILKVSDKDKARRFISLIDALYEARCRVLCLAETTPDRLFFSDAVSLDIDTMMAESVSETQDVYRPNVSSYDSPQMENAPVAPPSPLALEALSIFSGKDEQFAYKRALSRLLEMTSASYSAEERWAPLSLESRKWEGSAHGAPGIQPVYRSSRAEVTEEDFALEAEYAGVASMHDRPAAPKIRERHVWRVSDHDPGLEPEHRTGASSIRSED
ncbi:hypothetical protein BV25DRAFT_1824039 [Artomyces pyxidatus]|uniref:Uncharacterized protein n=1 Tax=Artomyces pyxidatus TaxID=48021 RepID=A0ACB8T5G7_9AGAM|nr:hypothetical protein BV25DRAFT_1824039 [Artomyces pyxidatus]